MFFTGEPRNGPKNGLGLAKKRLKVINLALGNKSDKQSSPKTWHQM